MFISASRSSSCVSNVYPRLPFHLLCSGAPCCQRGITAPGIRSCSPASGWRSSSQRRRMLLLSKVAAEELLVLAPFICVALLFLSFFWVCVNICVSNLSLEFGFEALKRWQRCSCVSPSGAAAMIWGEINNHLKLVFYFLFFKLTLWFDSFAVWLHAAWCSFDLSVFGGLTVFSSFSLSSLPFSSFSLFFPHIFIFVQKHTNSFLARNLHIQQILHPVDPSGVPGSLPSHPDEGEGEELMHPSPTGNPAPPGKTPPPLD